MLLLWVIPFAAGVGNFLIPIYVRYKDMAWPKHNERVYEYLMNLEENHMSFYERYYIDNSYDRMMENNDKPGPPPQ